ncbi:MAG: hypothetical protein AUK34_01995 [Ignavibacteria bacterium CG2_30_36_16]|nr:T9SS type A sorting domain-containing protein [Ignavibacteria bacterium]OIP63213.1 MAG: hypothetical protein AUK34_01995 [Ignavibacteria bacterium CG2_30_36_16]PJB00838.1 MAG: hypothetical protein CO127_06905 [Ignavibacteria bacterium CG_4_9_14_3_um_filter_36_18]
MKKFLFFIFFVGFILASTNVYAQALSGNYYIPQGANPQGFATLNDAVTSLNTNGANGTVNFLLDADTLRETSFTFNAALTAVNNVVIKPAPGKNVILFVSSSGSVGNGPFMIGFNKGYVTFDGSNNGTNSRNLIVSTEQLAPVVDLPFTLNNAAADSVVLKNLIIKNVVVGQTNFRYGAVINDLGGVMGFRVENCQIGTPERPVRRDALAPWGGGATANQFSFVDNELYCGTRGVATFYLVDSDIIGNTINILPTTAVNTNNYNHGIYITGNIGILNIQGNIINCLEKTNVAGTYLIGIAFAGNAFDSTDIINVFNNMINVGAPDETGSTYGIGLRSAGNMGNIKAYFNTIFINNNASTLTSHGVGNHTNGTGPVNIDLRDNIIINNHAGNTGSSAIGLIPLTSVLTSNYNLLLSNQNFVNYQGTTYANLAAWQATSQDLNSVSKAVNFVSATDLHLAGASIGDTDLFGIPIAGITTDIDGELRSATEPYKGADEAIIPGLQGIYYVGAPGTGPGGIDPQYSSLKAACDALNSETILGDVQMIITSNLVEPANVGLGLNPSTYTITFKPYAGTVDTILFTQVADNVGASGGLVIGVPDLTITSATNYGLVTTNNIVIDGSNSVNGTTRDLVFMTNTGISSSTYPIRLLGDVNNTTIKNIKVTAKQSTSYTLTMTVRNFSSVNYVPDNITIENCEVNNTVGTTAQGISISNSGTPTEFPDGIIIRNNTINARTRGIFLNNAGNTDVYNNQITVEQTSTGFMSYGIWGLTIGSASNVQNIYNNRILMLSTANANSGSYGIIGIEAGSKGTYNIYNNMIHGFLATSATANPNFYMLGIRNAGAAVTANIYFNSIYMPDQTIDIGTGTVYYAGIYISNGTNDVKNNIVVTAEADFPSYCIYRTGANGTLVSDYNDFYAINATNGNVGYWNDAATQTFASWQTASGGDANSINADPSFTSVNDLHLLNVNSPVMGKGLQIPWITTDIDGQLRDSIPEIGADEIPGVIPVELASFAASANGNTVTLNWETATETNSRYFEVERRSEKTWQTVGTVNASGTSTKTRKYSFVDDNVNAAIVYYRLKQVDMDGSYSYSNEIEVNVGLPAAYDLSQNYPNPFNPTTTIRYSIPQDSKVSLEVFSILGELVSTVVNEYQSAGKYTVSFNGSRFASGTYIYRLTANQNVITKKMVLIK